jgi:hypothetical protein
MLASGVEEINGEYVLGSGGLLIARVLQPTQVPQPNNICFNRKIQHHRKDFLRNLTVSACRACPLNGKTPAQKTNIESDEAKWMSLIKNAK